MVIFIKLFLTFSKIINLQSKCNKIKLVNNNYFLKDNSNIYDYIIKY
jgi:hypothetical protein